MGSSHFGELSLGNGRSGSSRKGKKISSEKPKEPQRGLGVAQLEKIRLQNQMASYLPSLDTPFHSNLNKMGFEDMERKHITYSESQSNASASMRSLPNHECFLQHPQFAQPTATLPLLEQTMEDSVQKKRGQDQWYSIGSSSQNSDSSDAQELDLDLRLSL